MFEITNARGQRSRAAAHGMHGSKIRHIGYQSLKNKDSICSESTSFLKTT